MDLFLTSRRLVNIESKLSCRVSRNMTIAIVRSEVIVAQSCFVRYRISANICMTGLLYLFCLFILG